MLNKLRDEIHQNAVEHGWWEEERSFGDIIALCHSELSEALEEYRAGRTNVWFKCEASADEDAVNSVITICGSKETNGCSELPTSSACEYKNKKPEGIAIELADCIIRILDYCGRENIDIQETIRIKHEFNKTRPFRHGGKKI